MWLYMVPAHVQQAEVHAQQHEQQWEAIQSHLLGALDTKDFTLSKDAQSFVSAVEQLQTLQQRVQRKHSSIVETSQKA